MWTPQPKRLGVFTRFPDFQLPSSVILNSRSSCSGLGPSPLNSFSRKTISAEEPPWRLSEVVGTSPPKSAREFRVCGNCMGFWLGEGSRFPSSCRRSNLSEIQPPDFWRFWILKKKTTTVKNWKTKKQTNGRGLHISGQFIVNPYKSLTWMKGRFPCKNPPFNGDVTSTNQTTTVQTLRDDARCPGPRPLSPYRWLYGLWRWVVMDPHLLPAALTLQIPLMVGDLRHEVKIT